MIKDYHFVALSANLIAPVTTSNFHALWNFFFDKKSPNLNLDFSKTNFPFKRRKKTTSRTEPLSPLFLALQQTIRRSKLPICQGLKAAKTHREGFNIRVSPKSWEKFLKVLAVGTTNLRNGSFWKQFQSHRTSFEKQIRCDVQKRKPNMFAPLLRA